ncbi:MAG: phasin family protein [Rhizobiaceae bacterium]|jgi:hypothetical protein|nr:MAG: phasin family protein [Rhizobiaceae bacterium]
MPSRQPSALIRIKARMPLDFLFWQTDKQRKQVMPTASTNPWTDISAPAMPFLTNGPKLVFALARLQANAAKSMLRYQIEAFGFLKHRCEENMKLVDALARSDEFGDALEVCGNFCSKAVADYSSEAGKVAEIGSRLATNTAASMRREAKTITDDPVPSTVG